LRNPTPLGSWLLFSYFFSLILRPKKTTTF